VKVGEGAIQARKRLLRAKQNFANKRQIVLVAGKEPGLAPAVWVIMGQEIAAIFARGK
jgi:hypothetical protein